MRIYWEVWLLMRICEPKLEDMSYTESTREDYLSYMEKKYNTGCKSVQLTFAIKSILTS